MSEYLNEDQRQLVDTLQRYLEREHPLPESGVLAADAPHPTEASSHWDVFAHFGLLALSVDETKGGIMDDPMGVHAVSEQFGRYLVNEPYLSTVVQGARLLAASDSDVARTLLERVLEGRTQLAIAHSEPQTDYGLYNIKTRATPRPGGWVIEGHKVFVSNAAQADSWLVVGRTGGQMQARDGLSMFIVDPKSEGIRRRDYFNIDGSSCSEIWLDGVSVEAAQLVGTENQAGALLESVVAHANAALCAEAVGAMSAVLDATVEYSKERMQFGVAIGSFQAIQHRLVDMYVQLEKSRSLALRASARAGWDGFFAAVSAAKAMCSQAARQISQSAIQLHGGIGMTDELALGKFVKRLLVISHTLGDEQFHRQQFARLTQADIPIQPHTQTTHLFEGERA